jgi:hypothetical protein
MMLPEKIQPFSAAGCRMDVIPVTGQYGLQEVAIHAIVVNDKDFDHRQRSAKCLRNTAACHSGSLPCVGEVEKQNSGNA